MRAPRDRLYTNVTIRLAEEANSARRRLESAYGRSTTKLLEFCLLNLEEKVVSKLTEAERAAYYDEALDFPTLRAAWSRSKAEKAAALKAAEA